MREFKADLHIHTCLSPCADLEMSPKNIVTEAKRRGLDMIGICDHNSAENVPAVGRTAKREGIQFMGGMEVTSKEEVHVLALFDEDERLFSFQEIVHKNLHGTNDEKLYGQQVIVNEEEEVLGFSTKLLIGATDITVDRLVDMIHEFGGLAIAAHVDRKGFGIIGQLGFIPPGLPLDAIELTDPSKRIALPQNDLFPFVTFSDAHSVENIGRRYTTFLMENVSIGEMRRSLAGDEGRSVRT